MKVITLIIAIFFMNNVYSSCLENEINDDVLKIEISPQSGSDIFMVKIIAANTWNGLPLESIVLEKNQGHVGLPIKSQPYYLDNRFTMASFWGTEEWLKNIDYCVFASYLKPASKEKKFTGYVVKAIPIVFNKALKAQLSATGTPQSGAP